MFEDAAITQIEARISDLQEQRKYADARIQRTIDGLIFNEQSRLKQYQRLYEIRNADGE
jgi:diaminopimelate epimerase